VNAVIGYTVRLRIKAGPTFQDNASSLCVHPEAGRTGRSSACGEFFDVCSTNSGSS
jgi:hypothetical protein